MKKEELTTSEKIITTFGTITLTNKRVVQEQDKKTFKNVKQIPIKAIDSINCIDRSSVGRGYLMLTIIFGVMGFAGFFMNQFLFSWIFAAIFLICFFSVRDVLSIKSITEKIEESVNKKDSEKVRIIIKKIMESR